MMEYKQNLFGKKVLSEKKSQKVFRAMYYAVRETFNQKLDKSKNKLLKEALELLKQTDKIPNHDGIVKLAIDDFLDACVRRGWEDELYQIPWLEVEKVNH